MSQLPVSGNGPIRVFLPLTGREILIPLSAVVFDDTHTPKAYAPGFASDPAATTAINARLSDLMANGEIRPIIPNPPSLAMVLQSVLPGAMGNDASAKITYNTGATAFDFEVTVTKTYTGLTTANLEATLGLGTIGSLGSSPGMAHLQASGTAPVLPAAGEVDFAGGNSTTLASAPIPVDEDTNAFTLEAWKLGPAGNKLKATISNVSGSTFDLKIEWKDTVNIAMSAIAGSIATINGTFGYVLSASAPPGGSVAAPQAGQFSLGGGLGFTQAQTSLISR